MKLKITWNKTLSPFSLAPRNGVTFFQVLCVLNYQFKGENTHLLFLTPSFAQQPFTWIVIGHSFNKPLLRPLLYICVCIRCLYLCSNVFSSSRFFRDEFYPVISCLVTGWARFCFLRFLLGTLLPPLPGTTGCSLTPQPPPRLCHYSFVFISVRH